MLATATGVVDALDKARIAQDAAGRAIEDTDEHLIQIENDLDIVSNIAATRTFIGAFGKQMVFQIGCHSNTLCDNLLLWYHVLKDY